MTGSIGDRLRQLRVERGLSQADLARDIVSASYVSLIKAGKRLPEDGLVEPADRLHHVGQDHRGVRHPCGHRVLPSLPRPRVGRHRYDGWRRKKVTSDRRAGPALFDADRAHLRSVAYRMLGSLSEADDAVQEAWLRLQRSDVDDVDEPDRLADDRGGPRLPGHAAHRAVAAARSRWSVHLPDPVDRRRSDGRTPSTRRCSPTRSDSPCWSCLETLRPAERWRSCCTTCSACPSTRSRHRRTARPTRRGSSPAAPAAGCRARRRPRRRPGPAARGRRRLLRRLARRRLRRAGRGARPGRRAARRRSAAAAGAHAGARGRARSRAAR